MQHVEYPLTCTIGERERRLPREYGEATLLWEEKVRMPPILGGMVILHMDGYMYNGHMNCQHFIGEWMSKKKKLVGMWQNKAVKVKSEKLNGKAWLMYIKCKG